MVEDISKIISNGFGTYTRNLNLSIPFVLNVVVTGLFSIIMLFVGFLYIFGYSLSSLESATAPEQVISTILPVISKHLFKILGLIIIYLLVVIFLQSFFMAGGIAMAQKATETGKSDLSIMIEAGKKNVVNLYLAEILVGLFAIAGIVLIIPGAMKIDLNNLSETNTGAILLLAGGVFLWISYVIVLTLVLAVFSYALVIENLGPVEAVTTAFNFFTKHKSDVFLLWLIIGVIIVVLAIIGEMTRFIPAINVIWEIINMILSGIVIPPLTTVWWVRLYMTRTGKNIYINELLAHPNDLEKLRANQ